MHDIVRLKRPLQDRPEASGYNVNIPAGALGTIVMIYADGKTFDVDFCDEEGETLGLVELSAEDFEVVKSKND